MAELLRIGIKLGKVQTYLFGHLRSLDRKGVAKQLRGRSFLALVLPELLLRSLDPEGIISDSLIAAGSVDALTSHNMLDFEKRLSNMLSNWESFVWNLGLGTLTLDVVHDRFEPSKPQAHYERWRVKTGAIKYRRWSKLWNQAAIEVGNQECERCGRRSRGAFAANTPGVEIVCDICNAEIEIGRLSLERSRDSRASVAKEISKLCLALGLNVSEKTVAESSSLNREILWEIPDLTFDELARSLPAGDICEQMDRKPALAMFKLDVDGLGVCFRGFNNIESFDRARKARGTLSAALCDFFDVSFPKSIKSPLKDLITGETWRQPLSHVYPLFSGGDDIVLIGPPSLILTLATKLNRDFSTYFNSANLSLADDIRNNLPASGLSFSGGYCRFGSKSPIGSVHTFCGELEHLAKCQPGKNALGIGDLEVRDETDGEIEWLVLPWKGVQGAIEQSNSWLSLGVDVLPSGVLYDSMQSVTEGCGSRDVRWIWLLLYRMSRANVFKKEEREQYDRSFRQVIEKCAMEWLEKRAEHQKEQQNKLGQLAWSLNLTIQERRKGG